MGAAASASFAEVPASWAEMPACVRASERIAELGPLDEAHPDDWRAASLYAKFFDVVIHGSRWNVAPWDEAGRRAGDDPVAQIAAKYGGPPRWETKPAWATREAALRWLRAALERLAAGQKELRVPVFFLCANGRLWTRDEPGEPGFVALKALALSKLQAVGEAAEVAYRGLDLGAKIGRLGAGHADAAGASSEAARSSRPRQDKSAGLVVPANAIVLSPQARGAMDQLTIQETGGVYCVVLLLAARILNPSFEARVKEAWAAFLEAAPRTAAADAVCRPAPVKSLYRMLAKLRTDHRAMPVPESAENTDVCRAAWVVPADSFAAALAAACAAFGGEPLRVKNNYDPDFPALTETMGYRALLVNFVYDSGRTWADFGADLDDVLRGAAADLQSSMRDTNMPPFMSKAVIDLCTQAATQYFKKEAVRAAPAKLVVELQMMTPEYYAMRKKTHAWYRIARAVHAQGMCNDYIGSLQDVD